MSSSEEEENVMKMSRQELQGWIQAEVDRNPQLMQRHQQLGQVEEWVKQKERDATYTRLLYSSACESVLECESVMKGLYGMLGLHYRDEDSEEEGGGGGAKEGVIHITDDEEEGGEEKRGCDDDDDVVNLAAAEETLEPMIEKVNMAFQKSSRLVEDLVLKVTKVSSMSSESSSSSDVISRPSSVLTPEVSSSGSITPAPSSPSINQTTLGENLEPPESTIAIIKTESMATSPCSGPNSDFTATVKTESQLTALSSSEISSMLDSSNNSLNCSSMPSVKTESHVMVVTPEVSFSGNSDESETSAIQNSDSKQTLKTEIPIQTPETFSLLSTPEPLNSLSCHTVPTIKTESHFTSQSSVMSPSSAEQLETTIATIKTEPSVTTLKAEMSLHESNVEQPVPSHNSDSITTGQTDPSLAVKISEEDQTVSGHMSTASADNRAARRRRSPVSSTPSINSLRSSTVASSVANNPSLQTPSSTSDSSDESDGSQTHHDDPTYSPLKSSKSKSNNVCRNPNNTSSSNITISTICTIRNAVTNPSLNMNQPAASETPSDVGQIYTISSSKSSESSETPQEIELEVNTEVLGKWKNKTWHRGKVKETQKTENGRRYKVEFKNGKQCVLPAHHVACLSPPLLKQLFVGCRLVCSCRDEEEKMSFSAGVLGELPDRKNRMRFLVFYDDGQVAYLALPDLHLVCKQLEKVWKDIENVTCRLQVKEYLSVYPNPIAVMLRVGQDTRAKKNGRFESCTVTQLDGNLVQICFKRDKQKEWLYRGSDNFEHIVTIKKRLAEQETQPAKSVGNTLSLTRVTQQPEAAVTKTPSTVLHNPTSPAFQPKVVLHRLALPLSIPFRCGKRPAPDDVEEHVSKEDRPKSVYTYHSCCPACLDGVRPSEVDKHRGQNPLQIPLLFNFRRMTARRRLDGKVYFHIFYRSPCGRSLCEMQEVQEYLFQTRCNFLFLEMFCMDPFVLVNRARPPSTASSQPHLFLPDISGGREALSVPCVNEVDQTPAPTYRYTKDRIPAPGVTLNTSLDFLTGCDCTDGCKDRIKCSCHQLTMEATSLCSGGPVDVSAGYTHKRLQTTLPTGVYECNPLCRCDPRICSNRLVQHGLQLRLELFMTRHKGWGIRCKDDVAKGTFVCVFTGKIVTEDKMNEDDTVAGNEYLANLDFIEGVEKLKEGYESEAYGSDTETENNKKTITMKTGPLWKNTLFVDDSSSGEEKDESVQLPTEQEMDVSDQETSGQKRCFVIKSVHRRAKPLETSDVWTGKTHIANNTRTLFNGEETCYIIDARQEGNLSRFINHSCSPNLFVQNVFVDTHDLRFPWVAFFTKKRIKAGTELTWDYNYEVGSVEGKVLLCCCGSSRCTGRLL